MRRQRRPGHLHPGRALPQGRPQHRVRAHGENSRNAAAAVPLRNELFEAKDCWARALAKAASFREAAAVTEKTIPGASGFVSKHIVNLIYDVDDLCGAPFLLLARDRASAPPVVGPGPVKSIAWRSGNACRTNEACAEFIHSATPALAHTPALLEHGAGPLWEGELSSSLVQLRACSAHRWASRLRLRIQHAWRGCRQARQPPVRLRCKQAL